MKILRQKSFTQWDETDNLKRAKDSDILAEQEKKKPGYGNVALAAGTGAVTGAAALAGTGMLKGAMLKKKYGGGFKGAMKGIASRNYKARGIAGAAIGAGVAGLGALKARKKKADEVQFYNDRLGYAKRQSLRRERKDWKHNMTNGREEYSY